VEEYNRDGPQEGVPSWMGVVFWMVAGFLIGGLPCLFAAFLFVTRGGENPGVFVVLLMIAPLTALSGGIVGMFLAWKRPKRPLL
jgi:hypothetical protein